VLVFVGIKMSIVEFYKIPPLVSLAVILGILTTSVLASLITKPSTARSAKLEALPGTLSNG
jgi:tellurite resistance protein TerC